jgi:hypothetical protein
MSTDTFPRRSQVVQEVMRRLEIKCVFSTSGGRWSFYVAECSGFILRYPGLIWATCFFAASSLLKQT